MPYYHIKIRDRSSTNLYKEYDYELNLSEEQTRVVADDYMNKEFVLFKGKWVNVNNIEEIEIRETPEKTSYYFPPLSLSSIFESSQFPDVTRKFLTSPPKGRISAKSDRTTQPLSKNIFIVHGRDHEPMKELQTMLTKFDLKPIVLHEQPSGSRTIVEKLEKYSDVGYAFVILTPDDVGALSEEIMTDRLLPTMVKPRARQNVVLEFGYFIGKLGRDRVCCLHKGNVERPSDMEGIVYIPFIDSVNEARAMIIKELKEAGYEIKL